MVPPNGSELIGAKGGRFTTKVEVSVVVNIAAVAVAVKIPKRSTCRFTLGHVGELGEAENSVLSTAPQTCGPRRFKLVLAWRRCQIGPPYRGQAALPKPLSDTKGELDYGG
jgi:hypothetical protein